MAIQTTATLGGTPLGSLDMVPVYLKKKLLPIVKKRLVFHQLGEAEDLPEGQGKVARWIRYDRIGAPFIPLTEGVTPTTLRDQPISKVEATVDQWGDVAGITDVAELTVFHKSLTIMQERMATQAAEVVDREIQRVLLGGSNILFPQVGLDRTTLAVGDVLNTNTIQRVLANLRDLGAPDWEGGMFMGVLNPRSEQDVIRDPLFQTTSVYGDQVALMNGEIGRWMGVRWMRSNFIPGIVENTAVNATLTTPVAQAGGTLSPNTNKDIQITGLSFEGFETQIGTVNTPGAFAAGDSIGVVLPALTAGVFGYNIYAGEVGAARTLQAEGLAPGNYEISGNGSAGAGFTGITYATTGRNPPIKPATGVTVQQSYIFGKGSFGVLELDPLDVMITPNTPSDSDPLRQRRKISWRTIFKAVLLNPPFFYRLEHSSAF